jgi:hypothetical protein
VADLRLRTAYARLYSRQPGKWCLCACGRCHRRERPAASRGDDARRPGWRATTTKNAPATAITSDNTSKITKCGWSTSEASLDP